MVLYILVVAILNLMIGFATAVYLARRREEFYPVEEFPMLSPFPVRKEWEGDTGNDETVGGPETPAPQVAAEEAAEPPPGPALQTLAADAASAGQTDEEMREQAEREKTPRELAVNGFRDQVQQYHQMLAGFDERLRNLTRSTDKEEVGSCLASFKQANEEYLGSRERVCEVFEQLHRERQEFQPFHNNVQAAMARQTEQIASTNKAIGDFNLDADLEEGCRQLVGETSKLLEVNDQLRDTLDEALVAVAREEKWLESVEDAGRTDPLTGLANRTGLESAIAQWWDQDPERQRQLTAAMIDVDQFARINEQYGHQVGNRILRELAQLLIAESREYTVAARYAGQRFVLLFGDVDVRFTTNLVERIRQLVELTHLRYGDEDIRVTISCAVTEAQADDSSTTLYARSDLALQEAKRYGRNRTFLHEGKYPTPVVPPNFSLEEKDIAI